MRKIVSFILCAGLLFNVMGCGKSGNENKKVSDNDKTQKSFLEPFDTSGVIEETVLVNNNGIIITATGIDYTDNSADINIKVENKTDKNISVYSNTVSYSWNSVNGLMVPAGYLACDVLAGETVEDTVSFGYSSLELYGIRSIADIEIGFSISDDEYNELYKGIGKIETSLKGSYDYSINYYQKTINDKRIKNKYKYTMKTFEKEELFNVNDVQIISKAILKNKEEDSALLLEIINESEHDYYISTSNIYFNDILIEENSYSTEGLRAGKKSIVDFSLTSLLEGAETDITNLKDISKIKFTLTIKDSNTYSDLYSDEIEVSVP